MELPYCGHIEHYCHRCGSWAALALPSFLCRSCMSAWIQSRPPSASPLAVLDLCCGAGGGARGYAEAGFAVWGVDTNNRLRADYLLSGAEKFICADVLDVLADRSFVRRFDFVHISPPCFPGSTPVTTARGVLPINSVRVGDLVLTHQGRWRPVTATMSRQADVYADGWLASTADHPFWAREQVRNQVRGAGQGNDGAPKGADREHPCENCGQPTTSRYGVCQKTAACTRELQRRTRLWSLSEPSWVTADSLQGRFIAIPATAEPLPVPPVPERRTSRGAPVLMNEAFWWMAGRWLGDGWLRVTEPSVLPPAARPRPSRIPVPCLQCGNPASRNHRYPHLWSNYCSAACRSAASASRRVKPRHEVIICCGNHEAEGLESKLAGTGLHWTRSQQATTTRFQTSHTGLVQWLKDNFGQGAAAKTVPGWLLGADQDTRQALLDGYLSADGHDIPGGHAFTTVSTQLAFGIRQLATTLGYTGSVHQNVPPREKIIDGRTVSQQPWWAVAVAYDDSRYTRADNLHRWVKRRHAMTFRGRETVYDLTVEEDHSFIAWGFAVHNCQRFSKMSQCRPGLSDRYPDLITPSRELLLSAGRPFIIENVSGARAWLRHPVMTLCGSMFSKITYRHRLFEPGNGLALAAPVTPPVAKWNKECLWFHPVATARAGHWREGMYVSVSGHERRKPVNEAMDIHWMRRREDVAESIPPYMTREIGRQVLAQLP